MAKRRNAQELVAEFRSNPGAENERLDFKDKGILGSKGGKKKLVRVLSAMANRDGGSVIIGVRRTDDGLDLQDFESDGEIRQQLSHIAQQYTSPTLTSHWNIEFEPCLGGEILRVDVESVSKHLIKFDYGGEYQVWIRDEDGMREMSSGEIADFYERSVQKRESSPPSKVKRTEHFDFEPSPTPHSIDDNPFSQRSVIHVDSYHTVVFGSGLLRDRIGKAVTYHLTSSYPRLDGYSGLVDVLQSAEEHLDIRTDRNFGYTIRLGSKQLLGRSFSALTRDLSRLREIVEKLDKYDDTVWNYGPLIAGYTKFSQGTLWFELQKEAEHFTRGNIGLILPDIPFDDSAIHSFFDEIDCDPHNYDHQHGLQFVKLSGGNVGPLCNPVQTDLGNEDDVPLYVLTDNPFYDWPPAVENELDNPIPERLTNGLSSVTRIPFQVSGGYLPDAEDRFTLNHLNYTQVSGVHPTLLVDALCWQPDSGSAPEIKIPSGIDITGGED